MSDDERLLETALHEAAHAAAAFELGVPFKRVSVIPDGDSSGRVTLGWRWSESKRAPSSAACIIVDLVGELVARAHRYSSTDGPHGEYVPDPDPLAMGGGGWMSGSTKDLRDAERTARIASWSPQETATFLAHCHARTVTIASKIWFRRRVEALVPVLLERREFSGRKARKIMRRAWPALKLRKRLRIRVQLRWRRLLRPARYIRWRSGIVVRKLRTWLHLSEQSPGNVLPESVGAGLYDENAVIRRGEVAEVKVKARTREPASELTPIGEFVICSRAIIRSAAGSCRVDTILHRDDERVRLAPQAFESLVSRVTF